MKKDVVLDKFSHVLKALKHEIIVVEGPRDKISLLRLGLKNIFVLNKPGVAFYSRVEALKKLAEKKEKQGEGEKKCAVLTDLDRKGKFLYAALKKELTKEGIKIDDSLRRLLREAKVSHIEGLATYLSNA